MSLPRFAETTPDKPAYIGAETGEVLTFRELNDRSIQLARGLRRTLNEGDRVALLLDNGPNYFVAAWAARRCGLRYVPVNWHLGVEEAAYIASNSDSRALIAAARMAELATTLAERLPQLQVLLADGPAFGRFQALDEALASEPAEPLQPEMEGVYMFYSSGTTGQPKGILRALPGKPFGDRLGIENLMAGLFLFDETARFYSPAPMYHAAPTGWCMGTQALGGTAVVAPRFDAEATLRHIEQHRITHAQFVPTHFVRLLQLPAEVRARYDVSSLRMVVHSAAPCPVEVKEEMMAWWGPIIHEYYGQSEGAGFTAVGPQDWLAHKGTVGRSAGGRILVVDDEGRELPPGETGHILFEGVERFDYHKEPGKTAEFFDAKGRSRPGDMGWVDADGYLYLTDRASHMIISGGVNIYPQEIEAVLTLHPAVRDVAVLGVPDPDFGEQVKAVVELKQGVAGEATLGEQLIAYCRERLAGFKCPKSVDFVDELPRLPTGKLLKRELRKRYWPENRTL
jgi:acyl-CoA synthetase (AMP-forming)/AMP-acid ligase II